MKINIKTALSIYCSLILVGCSLFSGGSKVEATYSTGSIISERQAELVIRKYFVVPEKNKDSGEYDLDQYDGWIKKSFLEEFESADSAKKIAMRDKLLDELIIVSDFVYAQYVRLVSSNKRLFDVTTDYYTLVLTGAGSLVSSATSANVLSGLATFVTGMKSSIDKNFFMEKTVDTLINVMDAQRLEMKTQIAGFKGRPIDEVSLSTAIRTVLEMHQKGNISNALAYLQHKSSSFKEESDTAYKATISN